MDQREDISEPPHYARAEICGRLVDVGPAVFEPLAGTDITRGAVKASGTVLPVVARGNLAGELASLPEGACIEAHGDLVAHHWRTGEGRHRRQIEILAKVIIPHAPTKDPR